MHKPKYRNDFSKFVIIDLRKLYQGPPFLQESLEFMSLEGSGDWGFIVEIMKKPTEITELTLENAKEFWWFCHQPYVVYDYPVHKFIDQTGFKIKPRLKVNNYEHRIEHEESWEEVAYILNNFKKMKITIDEANELAEKVEAHWDLFKIIQSKEIYKYLIPREMAVVPKAFIDDKDGNFKYIVFDNGHQEIIKICYATS